MKCLLSYESMIYFHRSKNFQIILVLFSIVFQKYFRALLSLLNMLHVQGNLNCWPFVAKILLRFYFVCLKKIIQWLVNAFISNLCFWFIDKTNYCYWVGLVGMFKIHLSLYFESQLPRVSGNRTILVQLLYICTNANFIGY